MSDVEGGELNANANANVSPQTTSSADKTRKVIWKHVLGTDGILFPSMFFSGPPLPENNFLRLSIEYFDDFISNELKYIMFDQTNLYSLRNDISKPLKITFGELEQWLGMCLYFSLNKIHNTALHWSLDFRNDSVSGVMSWDCWMKIKANLHLTNNENVNPDDSLFKTRSLVDQLQKEFRKIPMKENL